MEPTQKLFRLVFSICLVFALLLLFSFPRLEYGSGSYVAAVLSSVLILITISLIIVFTVVDYDPFEWLW